MSSSSSSTLIHPPESRWLAWGRSVFAAAVVVVLAGLGVANVEMRARWHEVEDGVLWSARAEGVTAVEVARGSAAAAAGIRRGDMLVAVNGLPVDTPADVVEFQHGARTGTRLHYSLLRLGARQALEVALAPAPEGSSLYFVLAAVGLFTLLVGASVRLRRPRDQATLHFFWLCVAFFGAFTFSFNGPFDRLDWVFYWGDAVAWALLPPLLLHFTLAFPERPAGSRPLVPAPARAADLPAGAGARRGARRDRRAQLAGVAERRRCSRAPSTCSTGPSWCSWCSAPSAAVFVLFRAFRRDHVADGAPPAAVDRLGHGARRRPVRAGLRAAVGARRRAALRAPAHGDSARPRAAHLRVGDRPLPAARRRGDRQARPRVHRVPLGEPSRSTWRC